MPITPVINGNESANSMIFVLYGAAGTKATVEFLLPPVLVGDAIGALPCSFAPNSVYLEETTERWDPNKPHEIFFGLALHTVGHRRHQR